MDRVRHFKDVLQGHSVTIVTDFIPLTGIWKSLQTNSILIRWQESLSELDTTVDHLAGKVNLIAFGLSRICKDIKIPPTRDSTPPQDDRHSSVVQLPVIINHLTLPTLYLHIQLLTMTSYTMMPARTNHRITADNSTRRYVEDNVAYWEFLDINYQGADRTGAPTIQLQQAA